MAVGQYRTGYRAKYRTASDIWSPTGVGMTYAQNVLNVKNANLLSYWPLWETSGTNADNFEGTAARDGTYAGVTLDSSTFTNGDPVGLWDGVNDRCEIYTASLSSAWDGLEGSISLWIKVANSGVWTDGNTRIALILLSDARNSVDIRDSGTNNQIDFNYKAANVSKAINKTGVSSTGWIHVGMSWSDSADEMKAYYNGVQVGSTVTGIGTWETPSLTDDRCYVGAQLFNLNLFSGYLCHAALYNTALPASDFATLATV